jgi:dephospho-CoA kinase
MIIGITGPTGSGKTTLLKQVERLGGMVLDCDQIYHALLQTDPALLSAIEARFPGSVEHGILQRKKLGAIVFSDKEALADLDKITHAAIKTEVLRQLKDKPGLVAIDAIGLFESKLNELCDVTVAVTAPEDIRVRRLMDRERISEDYARSRIAAQKSAAEFEALCDQTLVNDGDLPTFQAKCLAFFEELGIMKA